MKRIRTKIAFSGVPKGTEGTADLEKDTESTFGKWRITWELEGVRASQKRPLVDWFDQKEFDMYLEEI